MRACVVRASIARVYVARVCVARVYFARVYIARACVVRASIARVYVARACVARAYVARVYVARVCFARVYFARVSTMGWHHAFARRLVAANERATWSVCCCWMGKRSALLTKGHGQVEVSRSQIVRSAATQRRASAGWLAASWQVLVKRTWRLHCDGGATARLCLKARLLGALEKEQKTETSLAGCLHERNVYAAWRTSR